MRITVIRCHESHTHPETDSRPQTLTPSSGLKGSIDTRQDRVVNGAHGGFFLGLCITAPLPANKPDKESRSNSSSTNTAVHGWLQDWLYVEDGGLGHRCEIDVYCIMYKCAAAERDILKDRGIKSSKWTRKMNLYKRWRRWLDWKLMFVKYLSVLLNSMNRANVLIRHFIQWLVRVLITLYPFQEISYCFIVVAVAVVWTSQLYLLKEANLND